MSEFEAKTETITESKETPAPPVTTEVVSEVVAATEVIAVSAETTSDAAEAASVAEPNPDTKPSTVETETKETDVNSVVDKFSALSTQEMDKLRHIQATHAHLTSEITFSDPSLRIPPAILRAITLRMGFERPSEIQRTALPIVLDGHNLIAQAQSGAGKTVAFSVGMLNKIDVTQNYCQAICISPTKELADQIMKKAILPLSSYMDGIRIESARQGDEAVGRSCQSHVIVGTPGKVLSWLNKGYINGQKVKILVVDEADVMISKESRKKGLGVDTLSIRGKLSPQAQILFFSATYTEEVIDFSKRIIDRAYVIKLGAKEELVLDDIKQLWVDIKNRKGGGGKLAVLQDIYKFLTIQQSIIFVNEREVADDVSRRMKAAGFSVSTLHRSITESRDEIMEAFRRGDSKVLVATNALARGVDVPAVAVVVNFDLPMQHTNHSADTETYIHRIGRTGRFGKKGTAINFVANDLDLRLLREIEREYNPPGADGAGGGHAPMIQEWDVNDIEGLAALQKTEEGGDVIDDLGAGEEEEA